MNHDQIIAISDRVPANFSNPTCIGALRLSDGSSWMEEARSAANRGRRVVLAGDISNPRAIAQSLLTLIQENSEARFALLLHWTQAFETPPPPELSGHFDEIYVAIDDALTREQTVQIQQRWNAKWLILPSVGVDWTKWIPEILFPKKLGTAWLLAPEVSNRFIGADELRLMVDHLGFQHPTINVKPAPAEWFIPGEIGPWRAHDRGPSAAQKIYDSRSKGSFPFTAIVPFRWKGDENSLLFLRQCLESIRKTFPLPGECEIILSVDSENEIGPLIPKLDVNSRLDFTMVVVPRSTAVEPLAVPEPEDWRAGFIRNIGASFASPGTSSTYIFVDSDVEIAQPSTLRAAISDTEFDLFQLLEENQKVGFESATSMFLAIRRSLFQRIGGFADAFSHYGAEDNFLVWKCEQRSARIRPVAKANIHHLRESRDSDDLFVKMVRLRQSGSLIYRMTLDPSVHRHFFVSLGRQTALRGAVKWMSESILGRALLAPLVFALTFMETNRRMTYLRSFYDAYFLTFYFSRIERFAYFLRHHAADYSRRIYYCGKNEIGVRLRRGYYFARHHSRGLATRLFYDSRHLRDVVVIKSRAIFNFFKFRLQPLYYSLHRHVGRLFIANLWIFKEPTAWFTLKTPAFYKWVWRPLLKARFFLTYHLFIRWRNS